MNPQTVSLFCGAGGESLGKHLAFEELGIPVRDMTSHALNHWDLAVATHGLNFPWINVHQEDITAVTAADYGLDHINLLWASPSCIHHSRARGGLPKSDQQRSHAWEVVDRWLRVAKVDVLMIENVPEFQDWGPLDESDHPIKERKGEDFRAFVAALKGLGYAVEWKVLCAADYGDPTIRKRFFLQAVRDGLPIVWPESTHRNPKKPTGLFDAALPAWRTAAECIDWSIPVASIFDRKRPLAEATLRRIAAGVMRYVVNGRPFIVNLTHGGRLESIDEPLKTVTTANRGEKAIVSATMVGVGGRAGQTAPRGISEPMGTGTTKADTALVAASMVSLRGTAPDQIQASAGSVEEPLPTISAGGGHSALVAAFLAKHYTGVVGADLAQPLPTVTGTDHNAIVAASLIHTGFGEREGQAPRTLDIESPLGTVMAGGSKHALVAAFLQQYYSSGGQHQDPSDPLHAVTTIARHGLVMVEIDGETYVITDIGMRMLEPRELARAMGFPEWFRFDSAEGKPLTKRDAVKMVGNACPVGTVKALIKAVILQRPKVFFARGVA